MLRLDDEIYVVVPFTVKSPAIVTPPLNVAVSDDWLPIVKLPPKSEFNAVYFYTLLGLSCSIFYINNCSNLFKSLFLRCTCTSTIRSTLYSISHIVCFANVVPPSFSLTVSELISIVESSTLTYKFSSPDVEPPVRPSPADYRCNIFRNPY